MAADTIAAIATPLGEGGLAVIRISGDGAFEVADRCFRPARRSGPRPSEAPTHTVHLGHVHHQGQLVDEVLLTVMRAPRTYTREPTVEIACHGGLLPARRVFETVLAAGARAAEPGEFTKRAFLNGRLDLAQAEAVADIIHARTELALAAAEEQLAGKLSFRVGLVRDRLLRVLAHIEAQLDFPEDDLEPETRDSLLRRLEEAQAAIGALLATAYQGRLLRRGVRAVILGRPNVGKSSLLNQLLGHDRAIVSPVPGTTRDTIEEPANIRGLPVVLIDTAGLREAADAIEQEGVRRTTQSADRADLILHVLDASAPLDPEDARYLEAFGGKPRVIVLNKSDLVRRLELPPAASAAICAVSCLTGEGIGALEDAIRDRIWQGEVRAEMLEVTINARHQDALRRAQTATETAAGTLRRQESLEFAALDLRVALNAVGEIVGDTATDDLLDVVFREFCIGK